MRDQSITESSLKNNIYKSDFFNYDYLKDKDAKNFAILESDYISSNSQDYHFNIEKVNSRIGTDEEKPKYTLSIFTEKLLIRKCAKNISKCVRRKSTDRNKAVRELVSCLKWGGDLKIHRYDIKKFYESLDEKTVIGVINKNKEISSHTKSIVLNFLNQFWRQGGKGLPRGIEISNPLAALVLQDLDESISKRDDCVYYARFVDDIIAVSNDLKSSELSKNLKSMIPEELEINSAKSFTILTNSATDIDITFLGYKIKIPIPNGIFKYREVVVQHSENKVKDLKTKIFSALHAYKKNGDFELFISRLKFLSTNRSIKKGKGRYKSGIFYSACLSNNSDPLKGIDNFIFAILKNNGIGFLEGKFNFSAKQISEIKKIKFVAGFHSRYHYNISHHHKMEITKIWR